MPHETEHGLNPPPSPKKRDGRLVVGDEVSWDDAFCPVRGGVRRTGTVLAVRGQSIELDMLGTRDWRELKAMRNLRVEPAAKPDKS